MNERELFEEWYKSKGYSEQPTLLPNGNYSGWIKQELWQAWQASASRQGYKLVPIDTLEESLGWACVAEWDSPNKETDEKIKKHKSVIEKAVINAVN